MPEAASCQRFFLMIFLYDKKTSGSAAEDVVVTEAESCHVFCFLSYDFFSCILFFGCNVISCVM
jgi:hypothetical protein